MLRMAVEAFAIREEKVVERRADIDVAMVLGTGLADFRGGILKYACDLGLDRALGELRRLTEQCGRLYFPLACWRRPRQIRVSSNSDKFAGTHFLFNYRTFSNTLRQRKENAENARSQVICSGTATSAPGSRNNGMSTNASPKVCNGSDASLAQPAK